MSPAGPRLLVSVFSPDEVEAALCGGADIVDVKNPAEGALGAPTPALLRAVGSRVLPPVEVSAALGDAPHLPGTLALAAAGAAACGPAFVKVGLLGSAHPEQAVELLTAVRQAAEEVNPRTRVIAIAYAEAAQVGGLPPRELPHVARRAGISGVMLDTAVKDGVSTLRTLGEAGVAAFLAEARSSGLTAALAGSLALADLARVRELGPDIVGVRGAACEGGRDGIVSVARVRALREALGLSVPASLAYGLR